jgi:DHA2 family multidrug resistance protein
LFLAHTFTADEPFVGPALFRDRNFAAGLLFILIVGVTYLASLALLTSYLQSLMNYPIVTAGLLMGPRGIGTMSAMLVVGQLVGREYALPARCWSRACGVTVDVSLMSLIWRGDFGRSTAT